MVFLLHFMSSSYILHVSSRFNFLTLSLALRTHSCSLSLQIFHRFPWSGPIASCVLCLLLPCTLNNPYLFLFIFFHSSWAAAKWETPVIVITNAYPYLILLPPRSMGKLYLGRAIWLVLASEIWVYVISVTARLWHLRANVPSSHTFSIALYIYGRRREHMFLTA